MKAFVITILTLAATASNAMAQKGDDNPAVPKQLLKQIDELKATIARLKEQSTQQRAQADKARQAAEKRYLILEQHLKTGGKPGETHGQKRVLIMLHKGEAVGPKPPAELRGSMERLENLRVAIKHLQAAGMKDLAAEAAQRAEKMQNAIHSALHKHNHGKGEKPFHKPVHGVSGGQLREISAAIMQLRGQVQQLQKAVERLERRK